ncbi:MAG: polyprenyl synthetase family protein, partial [Pyrinomonadaceae bacterium]
MPLVLKTTENDSQSIAKNIFRLIGRELTLVERELERQAASNIQVISHLGEYLHTSGGKRLRPALTVLSSYVAGGNGSLPGSIRMAAVMEFLHMATLVHDDIIDNAETRRNRQTINSRYGNQTAVLVGDWLYMAAFETSLAERSLQILYILTAVTRRMTEGELIQMTLIGSTDITPEQYFDILKRKTAYLFSACCEIGAILGGGSEKAQAALRDYGLHLGMAFQLIDDLLDFTSTDEALGKPVGADILEGKLTFPLIYMLRVAPEKRRAVQSILREGEYNTITREEIRHGIEETGALDQTYQAAQEHL